MKKFALLVAVILVTAIAAISNRTGSAEAATAGAKCGGGLTASLTPLLKGTYDFTLVCIQHDKCYANWGISRSSCDTAFIGNMLAECTHAYPTDNNSLMQCNKANRYSCEYVAGKYHIAVSSGGKAAYEKAQREAVLGLFNGAYHGLGRVTAVATGSDGTSFTNSLTLPNPVVTVENGAVNGQPLVITTDPPLRATATAAVSVPMPVLGGTFTTSYTFSYSLNGPATVKGTISGGGSVGDGTTVKATGSLTGRKSVRG